MARQLILGSEGVMFETVTNTVKITAKSLWKKWSVKVLYPVSECITGIQSVSELYSH